MGTSTWGEILIFIRSTTVWLPTHACISLRAKKTAPSPPTHGGHNIPTAGRLDSCKNKTLRFSIGIDETIQVIKTETAEVVV